MPKPLTPTELARAVDISVSYACELLGTDNKPPKQPSIGLAAKIFRKTGWKPNVIAQLSSSEIRVIEKLGVAA